MVTWPESVGYESSEILSISNENNVNVSTITMDVHCGTHIDAPLHFLPYGENMSSIPLDKLIGDCFVLDCGSEKVIDSKVINQLPAGVKKVLFKTTNSKLWEDSKHDFNFDFVALNKEGANALVERKVHLVGVDYLSIQGFYESDDTHKILLENKTVLLETINLTEVNEGWYSLTVLPIKLVETEAAPCRAILQKKIDK